MLLCWLVVLFNVATSIPLSVEEASDNWSSDETNAVNTISEEDASGIDNTASEDDKAERYNRTGATNESRAMSDVEGDEPTTNTFDTKDGSPDSTRKNDVDEDLDTANIAISFKKKAKNSTKEPSNIDEDFFNESNREVISDRRKIQNNNLTEDKVVRANNNLTEDEVVRDNLTEDEVVRATRPGYEPWGYRVVTGGNELTVNVPFTTQIDDLGVKHYIKKAMAQWRDRTCVSFVQRSSESNYTNFVLNSSCSSMVGMAGGEQIISLGVGCRQEGKILHEIGHTLGLIHEHARPDRGSYITINTNNIQPDRLYNFEMESDPGYLSADNYDYMSIMHYSEDSFSNSSEPTIQTLDPRYQSLIGQRLYLTELDVEKVNMLYHCSCQYNNKTTTRDVKKYHYPCYYRWDVLQWMPYRCIKVTKETEWCLQKTCYNSTSQGQKGVHWVKDKMCYV